MRELIGDDVRKIGRFVLRLVYGMGRFIRGFVCGIRALIRRFVAGVGGLNCALIVRRSHGLTNFRNHFNGRGETPGTFDRRRRCPRGKDGLRAVGRIPRLIANPRMIPAGRPGM